MAMRPTRTMRIEITIATIGRLMKNLAMMGPYFPASACADAPDPM